ncbi:DUF3667 domain-containing protein [Pontibacter cellulosilyticus]|uniref:DUF3667 domain-containing protein n=1 Tax=Pontibacter cellulosilyticus TaxID=1720253 RepID=A0A923NAN2_9BACT|nr:DUF3667 domain-containing protein [Pontibacter cellulosilyticus]MBC5993947.1 DUF3667 domain-containing protein [Pontibacter cellulosilyticus]
MPKTRRKFTQCPNCGYTFKDTNNYCPNCGQENHDLNVPVKHLVAEFFEGTMHFDTKAWHTLKYLITKPGLLTEKFNTGQRASYVPPFRLYVFVSLIFFFVLALTTESSVKVAGQEQGEAKAILPGVTINANVADSLEQAADSAALTRLKQLQNTEQLKALSSGLQEDAFMTEFSEKFASFSSHGEESKQKLIKNLSFMMFLLMPFFALVLYLYYRKQDRNYVEHLMFSIHLHTFYFILLSVAMLLGKLFPALNLEAIVLAILVLYLYLALHQVYKQTYLRTLVSLLPIGFVYLLTLAVFFLGTVFVSVLLT